MASAGYVNERPILGCRVRALNDRLWVVNMGQPRRAAGVGSRPTYAVRWEVREHRLVPRSAVRRTSPFRAATHTNFSRSPPTFSILRTADR